jgi:hypothetical protein
VSRIPAPAEMAALIADLETRIGRLEKSPSTGAGAKVLNATCGVTATTTPSTSWQDIPGVITTGSLYNIGSGPKTYTSYRPTPLFILGLTSIFVQATAGLTDLQVRAVIRPVGANPATVWTFATTPSYLFQANTNSAAPMPTFGVAPAFSLTGNEGSSPSTPGAPLLALGVAYEAALQIYANNLNVTLLWVNPAELDVFMLGG